MTLVKNVYVSVSYVRNEVQNVRNYIYKTVQGRNLKMCDGMPYPEDGEIHVTCVIVIGNMNQYGFISDESLRNPEISKLEDVRFKEGND